MKITRQINRRTKTKTWYKHTIILSANILEATGWKPGDDLAFEVGDDPILDGKILTLSLHHTSNQVEAEYISPYSQVRDPSQILKPGDNE